ncbi:MAG: hypothetical protein OSA99_05045 [Acidimicrobiales bacterium]|nr:hypothetical protein [Acidimicrobiales bacterium]
MHPLIGHQGGWDEAIFVVLPLLLFAVLLLIARRRVDAMDDQEPDDSNPSDAAHG